MWFTSDIHFNHARIIELSGRPFSSIEEMNEMLIYNWNECVGPDEIVHILGDVCMGKKSESIPLLGRLNGKKFLTPGNHDAMHPTADKREWKRNEWAAKYFAQGVHIMPEQWHMQIGDQRVNICHFPYSGDHTEEERFTEFRPTDDGNWLLHGHVHELWRVNGRQFNVGVDANQFMPVPLDTIKRIINGSV